MTRYFGSSRFGIDRNRSQFGGLTNTIQGPRSIICPNPKCPTHNWGHPSMRRKEYYFLKDLAVIERDNAFEFETNCTKLFSKSAGPAIRSTATIKLIDVLRMGRSARGNDRKARFIGFLNALQTAYSSAVVSGKPYIRLKFCTAAPAAPLIRLSRQLIVSTRPRTMRTVMSQKFVLAVSFEPGR